MRPSLLRLSAAAAGLAALFAAAVPSRPLAAAEPPAFLASRPRPEVHAPKVLAIGEEVRTAAGQRRRVGLPDGTVLLVNEKSALKRTAEHRVEVAAGEVFVQAAGRPGGEALVVRTPKREVATTGARFALRVGDDGTGVVVASGRARVNGVEAPLRAGQELAPGADRPGPAPRASHVVAWARDLVAQGDGSLVPASRHAGGSLVVRDADGQEARLALRKYLVDVHVEDGFARTTIDQTFFNATHSRLEGTFYFPLPPDASLSRLAMYVDGRLTEGGMVERDYGRVVYERIVHQQKDPALLEWLDGSTFKMRVFPLEPRQEKRLVLGYTQRLPTLYGQASYRFPSGHSLDTVRDFSVHVRVKNGARLAWHSPSHAFTATTDGADLLLDAVARDARQGQDVVLTLDTGAGGEARFSTAQQDGTRYLMVRYRPTLPGAAERQRRDWVFLFESSGDRDPLLARTQIEIVRGLLASADPDDTFTLYTANTHVYRCDWPAMSVAPENVAKAIQFLETATHLVGALDLGQVLRAVAHLEKEPKNPYLVHLGSGIAAMGERRVDELVKLIPAGTHYVGVGVGKRWNRDFMKAAAERTGGYFTQINPDEPVSWRAFDLAATLNTPRLLDVRVADRDGRATFLPFAGSLAQGEELAAVARVAGGDRLPEVVTVRGTLDGRPFERDLPVKDVAPKAGYLPRTWAKLEIERLLAEDAAKHKDAIVALSKAMYVMTPFTSLLVLENEDMYTQFKVDRGRKDHWAPYPCPEKIDVVHEPEDGQPGDPRKGIKPSARQVLKTIVARELPRVLGEIEKPRLPPPIAHSTKESEPLFLSMGFAMYSADPKAVGIWNGSSTGSLTFSPDGRQASGGKAAEPLGEDWEKVPENRRSEFLSKFGLPPTSSVDLLRSLQLDVPERPKVYFQDGAGVPPADQAPSKPAPLFVSEQLSADSGAFEVLRGEHRQRALQTSIGALMGRPAAFLRGGEAAGEEASVERLLGDTQNSPSLLYQRPGYSGDERLFFDLVAYAPGLNTSAADVRAVLEAEAAPDPASKPGTIDPAAHALLDRARPVGWRSYTFPAEGNAPAWTVTFDGTGRYAWERRLAAGLSEQGVCDGTTLLHLYPDLGLASRRTVSRFHRLAFARLVPWALPPAEDLARGADLRLAGERTVAVVPHAAGGKDRAGKPLPSFQVRLVFRADGPLAERRVLDMSTEKVLFREVYTPDGTVRHFDEDGKETVIQGTLADARAPDLRPRLGRLVVLDLPFRTPDHVRQALGIANKQLDQLTFEEGRALLAAEFAAGNGDRAADVFRRSLHARDQRQIGWYVLLAACGQNLDSEHLDVLAEHLDEPLAQYLALHSSPVLRKHASQWAAAASSWGEGFLQRLALSHALYQRWQTGRISPSADAQRRADWDRARAYVARQAGSAFGWALLGLLADRAREDEANKKDVRALHRDLADAWTLFAEVPGLGYAARYEQARSLWKSGQHARARRSFLDLYERTLREGYLPPIDADLRAALLGDGPDSDAWGDLLRRSARRLVRDGHRPAVLLLARQCWQLGDQPLAQSLYATALDDLPAGKERLPLRLAGLEFLWETGQLAEADEVLGKLLADPEGAGKPGLWRLGMKLAQRRDMPARELECLEKALDLEYRDLPEVIDLQAVRADYKRLLESFQAQAEALAALHYSAPADFRDRVERVADRWRALDREGDEPCRLAARILHTLGDREEMWDYLTTPVGRRPNEAGPWADLARTLARQGDLVLADRAFAAAFEAEPTDAQVLWERAQNLAQAGQADEAQKLYRRLAEGPWQPRFQGLQNQARWHLEKR
jgi:hypothetical protein